MKKIIIKIGFVFVFFLTGVIIGNITMFVEMINDGYKLDTVTLMPYEESDEIYEMNKRRIILTAKIAATNREMGNSLLKALDGITEFDEIELTQKIYENDKIYELLKDMKTSEIINLIDD